MPNNSMRKTILSFAEKSSVSIVLLLGVSFCYLWLSGRPSIDLFDAHILAPVFNTTICLCVASAALLFSKYKVLVRTAALFLVSLSSMVVFQDIANINLNIDQLVVKAIPSDYIVHSGRMAPETATSFILLGIGLWLIIKKRIRRENIAIQGLIIAILFMAIISGVGKSIHLELMYDWYGYARMSLPAAFGLILLCFSLWLRWYSQEEQDGYFLAKSEARISATVAIVLIITILTAGISSFGLMTGQIDKTLEASLLQAHTNFESLIVDEINAGLAQTQPLTTRLLMNKYLPLYDADKSDKEALNYIRGDVESFRGQRFSAISIVSPSGVEIVHEGNFVTVHDLDMTLIDQPSEKVRILWDNGAVLHIALDITSENKKIGMAVVEIPLKAMSTILTQPTPIGKTAEARICSAIDQDHMKCLPSLFSAKGFVSSSRFIENNPTSMDLALKGQNGNRVAKDYRLHQVFTSYGQIGDYNLGLVVKIDTSELYGPIRTRLEFMIAFMVLLAAFGIALRYVIVSKLETDFLQELNKKIRDSESRYDLVVRGMSVGLWDWKIQSNELYWSPKLREIFGVTDQSLNITIEYFSENIHPDDKDATINMLQAHLDHEGLYNAEYRFRRQSGEYIWVQAAGQAEWDKNDKPFRMAGSVVDITERKKAEEETKKLISIIEESSDYIGISDIEGNLQYHNRSALRMIGLPEGYDISTLKIADMHPQWAATLITEIAIPEIFRSGIWEGETALLHRDGHEIPVLQNLALHRDSKGEPIRLTTIIRDITERKKAEQALQASELTFRSAMERASIGMALVSTEGKWLRVNNALCELLGYSEEEFLKTDFQAITHPEDLEADMELVAQMLRDEIQTYQLEKRYFHKKGHILWILLSVSLARGEDGKPKYFISQIQDITERVEVERMKGEFISVVSHELRTPLTSIRGSLGLIQGVMSKDLPDKVNHLVDLAYKNTERLILLINDILDIDKITSGQMQFQMKEESLSSLVFIGVETNAGYGEKYKVRFETEYIPSEILISVDAARWQQAFANLLSNAAKFSPEDGAVKIAAQIQGNKVRLSVKDSGPGIPEEFKARIFGKFAQENSTVTRTKGGSGLGLNISKEIVSAMNGSIGFDTELGKGTTFWMDFPYFRKDNKKVEHKNNDGSAHEQILIYKDKKVRVLHVEDDTDFVKVINASLNDNIEIVVAENVAVAKAYLKKEDFSLVLLDIGLPDASGLSLIDYIHTEVSNPSPIAILSADEPPIEFSNKVDSVLLKSRTTEKVIIDTIMSLIKAHNRKVAQNE